MRADAPLDYAIFQLTPTRTRCELLIAAHNGTYKLASGLLKPFINHLKSAEEQLARGGYSIRLEPPEPGRTTWFTRRTMERFVRFVSTPEVLERVSTAETELIELEETARQQSADDSNGQAEDQSSKSLSGGKSTAIVPFEKSPKASKENSENGTEENSKQRLLRALDARRQMLQKEQGMAFARALAAGFSLEDMGDLVLFAECFGANRMREACLKFVALCKKRQEAGLAIEEFDLVAAQSDMSYMANGINLNLATEIKAPTGENGTEKLASQGSLDDSTRELLLRPDHNGDVAPARGSTLVQGTPFIAPWQGQAQGQFMQNVLPHPQFAYPPYPYPPPPYPDGSGWQMHPSGPPPYWPPNPSREQSDSSHPYGDRSHREKDRHDRSYNSTAEDHYDSDEAMYQSHSETRRASRRSSSRRRQSASPMRRVKIAGSSGGRRGMVVIRNINYIAPKSQNQDDDEDEEENLTGNSASQSEDDGNGVKAEDLKYSVDEAVSLFENMKQNAKDGKRKSTRKGKKKATSKDVASKREAESSDDDAEAENGHVEKDDSAKELQLKRETSIDTQRSMPVEDGLVFVERGRHGSSNDASFGATELEYGIQTKLQISGASKEKQLSAGDDTMLLPEREGHVNRSETHGFDVFATRQQNDNRRTVMDDSFIVVDSRGTKSTRDTTAVDVDFEMPSKSSNQSTVDESFLLVDRPTVRESRTSEWRMPMDIESEMPAEGVHEQEHDAAESDHDHDYFEPDDVFMVPERNRDSYNRAWETVDYDMEVLAADMMENGQHRNEPEDAEDDAPEESIAQEEEQNVAENGKKAGTKQLDPKAKAMIDRRRSLGGRPGRPNPLAEAQIRADKLRAYKAGLLKSKKEKEEEDRKRIEDLKRQRQERIAARSVASRTTPTTPGKPSPKPALRTTPTASTVSPIVSRERTVSSKDRLARLAMPNPRLVENTVSRSVPSATDLQKEARKSIPVVRASTGSQLSAQKPKRTDATSETKSNGHIDEKVKVLHESEKIGRTDSGITGESVARRSTTVAKTDAQSLVTKSVKDSAASSLSSSRVQNVDVKTIKTAVSPAPVVDKKTTVATTVSAQKVATKTVTSEKVAIKNVTSEKVAIKNVTSEKVSSRAVNSEKMIPKATTNLEKVIPKESSSEKVTPKATNTEKVAPKKALPSEQKTEIKTGNVETPLQLPVETPQIIIDVNAVQANGKMNVDISVPSSVNDVPAEGVVQEYTVPIPIQPAEEKVHVTPSVQTKSAEPVDKAQVQNVGSSTGEECQIPVAHVSFSEDNSTSVKVNQLIYEDIKTPPQVIYSPPFASPSQDHVYSSSVNDSHSSNVVQEVPSPEENIAGGSGTRSRKKWGDTKAKGLKKLLLLGRKSSKSSSHEVLSDGEEEDSSLSTGKSLNPTADSDGYDEQVFNGASSNAKSDVGSGSSSKGSRSFFSLSNLRGKSNTVKA